MRDPASRIRLDPASRGWSLAAAGTCLLPLLLQLPAPLGVVGGGIGAVVALVSWRIRIPGLLRLLMSLGLLGLVLQHSQFHLGRDTGCALLAAMLAIKPVELATLRDARSLLGFALFAPFATFLLDQGPLSLLLGLAGALLVLTALLRLSELESGVSRGTTPRSHPLTVLRLVAVGLPLAMAAFWLFPRIATPLWGVPERALTRPGLSEEMRPGEWIDLMGDDSPALRVKFMDTTPLPHQMYWRGPVLTDYDGRSWRRASWLASLPPPAVRHDEAPWDYEIEIEPTERRWVVALDLPLAAPDGAALGHDYSMSSPRRLDSLSRWRMRSAPAADFETELDPGARKLALQLPEGYNPRTLALARQWRQEAGADDALIVRRALEWVNAEFGYTMSTPLPGRHAVDEFLFEYREGFCEHFSSAFAVLMRAAGIPARVVTGYAGGYYNRFGDYWIVRRMDAHAWVEVWLEGRGWVRMDPTAAVAPERVFDTLEDRVGSGLGAFTGKTASDIGDWLRRGWNDLVLGFDAARQQRILRPLGLDSLSPGQLLALFAATACLALGWMLWLVARGERERDPMLRAWRRIGERYARLGLGRAAHEPALAWATRVEQARPQEAALSALSARFAQWRYAPEEASPQQAHELLRDLRSHRPAGARTLGVPR